MRPFSLFKPAGDTEMLTLSLSFHLLFLLLKTSEIEVVSRTISIQILFSHWYFDYPSVKLHVYRKVDFLLGQYITRRWIVARATIHCPILYLTFLNCTFPLKKPDNLAEPHSTNALIVSNFYTILSPANVFAK